MHSMNIRRSKAMTWKRREEIVTKIWMAINLLERWALHWKTTSNVVIFTLRSGDLKFKFNCWFPAQFLSATSRLSVSFSWYADTTCTQILDWATTWQVRASLFIELMICDCLLFFPSFFFLNPGIFLFLGRYLASKALIFHWLANMGRTTGFKTIRFLNKVDGILETKRWNSLFPFYSNLELRKVIFF